MSHFNSYLTNQIRYTGCYWKLPTQEVYYYSVFWPSFAGHTTNQVPSSEVLPVKFQTAASRKFEHKANKYSAKFRFKLFTGKLLAAYTGLIDCML